VTADRRAWLERLLEAAERAADDLRGPADLYQQNLLHDLDDLRDRLRAELDELDGRMAD
jgi:hypothetical protein